MADTTREEPITIKQNTWVGGVQDFLPYNLVRDTSAVRLENCEIHVHGTVRRRGGLRKHVTHTATSSDYPLLLKGFSGIRGIGPLLAAAYRTDSSTAHLTIDQGGTNQATFGFPVGWTFDHTGEVFKLLDRVYVGKVGQVPLYWEVGATALQQELAVPGFPESTIPPIVTGVFFQGRGWAGGDPAAEDLVYFSNALGTSGDQEASRSPLVWDRHFQAFRMDGRVRAIVPFRNTALVVFTDNTIEMLEPNCCEILETHRLVLHRTTGCPFRQTIQICGEDIFFMDQEGHIRSLKQTDLDESQGVTNAPLSLTIKNVIDRQTKYQLERSRSCFSKGIYWIAMPTDGSQVANEMWGWSIRDQGWVGPHFFEQDKTAGDIFPQAIGGMASLRFDGDDERLYLLNKKSDTSINTYIALETKDLTDDGTLIPVVVETKSYSGTDARNVNQELDHLRKTWFHTEQEMRFLIDPGDITIPITVEVRPDEGGYFPTDNVNFSPDGGPRLPVALPFALSPETRQNLKVSLAGIVGEPSYGLMKRITIRDSVAKWEFLTSLVTGIVENPEYATV